MIHAKGGIFVGTISDQNTRMSLTIPKELKASLEKIAKEQNRSLNNLIITLLKDYTDTPK